MLRVKFCAALKSLIDVEPLISINSMGQQNRVELNTIITERRRTKVRVGICGQIKSLTRAGRGQICVMAIIDDQHLRLRTWRVSN